MASMPAARLDGVASLPARASGAFVDGLLVTPILLPASYLVHPRWVASAIVLAAGCVYQIPQIAIWGMTVGARAAGVRVTDRRGLVPG